MRIAINALAMRRELYGVANYIRSLIQALSRVDSENEYLVIVPSESACHVQGLSERFYVEVGPGDPKRRIVWEQTVLPWKLKQNGIDVYHGPAFAAPLLKTCRQVVTVHDTTFRLTPKEHALRRRLYLGLMVPAMVRRCDRMIAVSNSTKADVLDLEGAREEKIEVVPLGVDERFAPMHCKKQLENVRKKYGLPDRFILFVGVIEPRKNLERLVEAYVASSVYHEFGLVLAGSLGWGYSNLLDKVNRVGIKERIHMPGYVADADLPTLYSAASAFVYPSLYEGFGLPVLEAMACGTPVITSCVSSLPEVAGRAAVLIDPQNTSEIASALCRVLSDRTFAGELSALGRERAKLFNWEQTARESLAVYERTRMEN